MAGVRLVGSRAGGGRVGFRLASVRSLSPNPDVNYASTLDEVLWFENLDRDRMKGENIGSLVRDGVALARQTYGFEDELRYMAC
jgi:hypothetical protein